jgi:hypothetical protein
MGYGNATESALSEVEAIVALGNLVKIGSSHLSAKVFYLTSGEGLDEHQRIHPIV